MRRHRNAVNALLFFAPIGVVLSAIPQAPDFALGLGWGLTIAMLLAAFLLHLRFRRAEKRAQGSSADESVDVLDGESMTGDQR
jgi:Na+-driven multidrug efflux pump